jgi:riboflavin kinase/FMN adenylyltransferase
MRILRDKSFIGPEARGASLAIGNFDGVHLGHRAVIEHAREIGSQTGAPLGVLTFEPHPRELFAPDAPPFRLMNAGAKAHRLEKLGVELLYELSFTRTIAALAPEAFAREILAEALGAAHVTVGRGFRFGRERAGTTGDLARFGERLGFGVTAAPLVETGGREISSTSIRAALSEGRPRDAAEMLGHWHRIEGEVIRGDQRGRELGYPTANMSIAGLHPPRFGVYAVEVDVLTGPRAGRYIGASSIGVRPMFGENLPNCETFLFDFAGDLYGARLSVALVAFLRPEARFDSVEALLSQMRADCEEARRQLAARP